jgi:hypothetical protein
MVARSIPNPNGGTREVRRGDLGRALFGGVPLFSGCCPLSGVFSDPDLGRLGSDCLAMSLFHFRARGRGKMSRAAQSIRLSSVPIDAVPAILYIRSCQMQHHAPVQISGHEIF